MPSYGISGRKFEKYIRPLVRVYQPKTVLDYGCGKATLGLSLSDLHLKWRNYDPAIPEFAQRPEAADLVVCTDVAEHIEPESLDAVLDDLRALTIGHLFMTIANRPAKKVLADGRNAHLIQEDYRWWLPKIWERWSLAQFVSAKDKEYMVVAKA